MKVERAHYELELNKTREAALRNEQNYIIKVNNLEEQLQKSQSLYVELDDNTKIQISKLRQDMN